MPSCSGQFISTLEFTTSDRHDVYSRVPQLRKITLICTETIVSAERHTSECANEQQLVCLGQSRVGLHYTSKRKFACMLDFVNKQARLDHALEDSDDPKCWLTNKNASGQCNIPCNFCFPLNVPHIILFCNLSDISTTFAACLSCHHISPH